METTPIVLSPNTQVGNFRATDDSATASYRQYADAAASAGLNTMQFNNVSQPADWASVVGRFPTLTTEDSINV